MKMLTSAKAWTKKVLLNSSVLRMAVGKAPPAAVILMYHSVQHRPEDFENSIGTGIIHAAAVFERQMELLARRFRPVTLEEILLFVKGERKLPKRAVAVTFDDGFADNTEIAAPILARYGIRAAFYVTASLIGTTNPPWYCRLRFAFATSPRKQWRDPTTGRVHLLYAQQDREKALLLAFDRCASLAGSWQEEMVGRIESDLKLERRANHYGFRYMMDWDQVRGLVREGHIVGSHTLTHPNLAHVTSEEVLRSELTGSKHKIEKAIGSPVDHFSYPHPALNPQLSEATVRITQLAGYRSAVTTMRGPVRADADPLRLSRIGAPRPEHQFLWDLEWTFLCGHARSA